MKKIVAFVLLAVGLLSFTSCDLDDDGPSIAYEMAEVTGADLPEYFEFEESYEINVDYMLPSACHTFEGFEGNQGENEEDETIFEYYIQAVTSYDPSLTDCNEEDDDLNKTSKLFEDFEIESEDYTVYRFNFLTGYDNDGDPEFLTIDVPVGAPDDENDEDDEDQESEED